MNETKNRLAFLASPPTACHPSTPTLPFLLFHNWRWGNGVTQLSRSFLISQSTSLNMPGQFFFFSFLSFPPTPRINDRELAIHAGSILFLNVRPLFLIIFPTAGTSDGECPIRGRRRCGGYKEKTDPFLTFFLCTTNPDLEEEEEIWIRK